MLENTIQCDRGKQLVSYIRAFQANQQNQIAFDPTFYQLFYDDVAHINDPTRLLDHYNQIGANEGRFSSVAHLLKDSASKPEHLPDDFNIAHYCIKNFDIFGDGEPRSSARAIKHYLFWGRAEGRIYKIPFSDKSRYNLDQSTVNNTAKKVAFLVHIFYQDLWAELISCVKQLQGIPFDLYVSVVECSWSESFQEQILRDMPDAKIIVTKNHGRDIGGQISLMRTMNLDDYDVFCLLHTKKSPHTDKTFGDQWRKKLCAALLKNPAKARENIALFRNNPTIGLLGNGAFCATGIEANAKHYNALLEKFGIEGEARACEFVAGTMFMVRPEILKPLVQTICPEQMEPSALEEFDGLQAHALERIIGNLVRHFGYTFFWQTED